MKMLLLLSSLYDIDISRLHVFHNFLQVHDTCNSLQIFLGIKIFFLEKRIDQEGKKIWKENIRAT